MTAPAPAWYGAELPSTMRDARVVIDGCPGEWATKTGTSAKSPVTAVWPGGSTRPIKLGGPADLDNLVVGQPYFPTIHQQLKRQWKAGAGRIRVTAHVMDLDSNGVVIGDPTTYPQALIVTVNEADVDWSSGNPREWSVELALGDEL